MTSTREKSAKGYFASRAARLYSVVVVGLLLTLVFDALGSALNPGFYANEKVLMKPVSLDGYLSALLFVNEYQIFGFGGISPGSNSPFWSLSFEATYYVLAGLFLFFPRRLAWVAGLAILVLAGRTIAALLPIWLLGFAIYHIRDRGEIARWLAWAGFIASAVFLLFLQNMMWMLPIDNFGVEFPWGRKPFNRVLLADYLVALVFGLHLFCGQRVFLPNFGMPKSVEKPVRWLGGLTFPLYCFHYPAICLLSVLSPWTPDTLPHVFFLVFGVAILVVLLTPICDRFKLKIYEVVSRQWGAA